MASLHANILALDRHKKIKTLYETYYITAKSTAVKKEFGKLLDRHERMIRTLESRIKTKGVG